MWREKKKSELWGNRLNSVGFYLSTLEAGEVRDGDGEVFGEDLTAWRY